MRTLISLILILSILCGCTCVFAADPLETIHKELAKLPGELAQKVEDIILELNELTDDTRAMTDEELAEKALAIAGEHDLTLNDEQLKFIIAAVRSLETADDVGDSLKDAGEKVSKFRQTLDSIQAILEKILAVITNLFNGLVSLFT